MAWDDQDLTWWSHRGAAWEGVATDNDAGGHHGQVLPSLTLVYAWDEQRALDATLAVNALFLAAMLVAGGVVAYMLTVGDRTQEYLAAMFVSWGGVVRWWRDPAHAMRWRDGLGNAARLCVRRRAGRTRMLPVTSRLARGGVCTGTSTP